MASFSVFNVNFLSSQNNVSLSKRDVLIDTLKSLKLNDKKEAGTQPNSIKNILPRSDSVSSDSSQSITSRMLAMLDAGPGHVKKN